MPLAFIGAFLVRTFCTEIEDFVEVAKLLRTASTAEQMLGAQFCNQYVNRIALIAAMSYLEYPSASVQNANVSAFIDDSSGTDVFTIANIDVNGWTRGRGAGTQHVSTLAADLRSHLKNVVSSWHSSLNNQSIAVLVSAASSTPSKRLPQQLQILVDQELGTSVASPAPSSTPAPPSYTTGFNTPLRFGGTSGPGATTTVPGRSNTGGIPGGPTASSTNAGSHGFGGTVFPSNAVPSVLFASPSGTLMPHHAATSATTVHAQQTQQTASARTTQTGPYPGTNFGNLPPMTPATQVYRAQANVNPSLVSTQYPTNARPQKIVSPTAISFTWDGREDKVLRFITQMRAKFGQAGLHYLIHEEPLHYFIAHGIAAFVAQYEPRNPIAHYQQVQHDNAFVFHTLAQALVDTTAIRFVDKYEATFDGCSVWYHFVQEYDHTGNREARADRLETAFAQMQLITSSKSLRQFVRQFDW